MPHPLDGVWAKLDRARHHLDTLHAGITRLLTPEKDDASAPYEYYPDRKELIVKLPKATPADPTFSLLIGDCIHNTRSALDHLIFQLAILNKAGIAAASKTSFPVYLTSGEFKNAIRGKVAPFISAASLTEIEKLQPYAADNAGADDIIWVLSQLDIIDKHRLLLITESKFRPIAFTLTVPSGEQFSKEIPAGNWKSSVDGAEIIRFDLSGAIKQPGKVNVQIKTAGSIQIESTGLVCDGMPVEAVLSDCIQLTINIVGMFQEKFFGL